MDFTSNPYPNTPINLQQPMPLRMPQQMQQNAPQAQYNFSQQQADINNRKALALMMTKQGEQPLETNQMAGGFVVPVSPWQALSKVINQGVGAYSSDKASKEQTEYDRKKAEALGKIMQSQNPIEAATNAGLGSDPLVQKIYEQQLKNTGDVNVYRQKGEIDNVNKPYQAGAVEQAKTPALLNRAIGMIPVGAAQAGANAAATSPYAIGNAIAISNGTLGNKIAAARAGAPMTNVQISNSTAGNFAENAGKVLGGKNAENFAAMQKQAAADQVQLPKLQSQLALINSGANQGFGADFILKTRKMLRAANLDNGKNLSDAEVLNSLTNDSVVAQLRQNPGVQTESDYLNQLKSAASLNKERSTNQKLVQQQINEINQRNEAYKQYGNLLSQAVKQNDPSVMFNAPAVALQNTQPPANSLAKEGATATNPSNGQKMILKGGQWQPMQ